MERHRQRGRDDITVQNSIDADPTGQQFAAHTETGPYTWYDDLFANAHNRCPLAKANSAADATGDFDHTGCTNVEKYVDSLIDGRYP